MRAAIKGICTAYGEAEFIPADLTGFGNTMTQLYASDKALESQADNLSTLCGKTLTYIIWAALGEAVMIGLECAFGTIIQ